MATTTRALLTMALLMATSVARADDPATRARAQLEDVRAGRAEARAFLAALDAARAVDGPAADRLLVDAAFAEPTTGPRRPVVAIAALLARLDRADLREARADVERALLNVHRLWWRKLPAKGWRRDTAEAARALAERIREDLADTALSVARLDGRADAWSRALTPFLDRRLEEVRQLEVVGGDERVSLVDAGAVAIAGRGLSAALGELLGEATAPATPTIEVRELGKAYAGGRVTFTLRLTSPGAPLRSYAVTVRGAGDLHLETARLPEAHAAEVVVDLPAPSQAGPATLKVDVRLADGTERSLELPIHVHQPLSSPRRIS